MATTTTRTLPPQFIEDIGVDLSKSLVASTGVPTVSVGLSAISQRPGESAADFAARQTAAKAFETRQQSLAGIAPQIAGQDALQTQAAQLAKSGVGSYQQFVDQAKNLTGAGAGAGAGSVSEYMSPYQQQVIDVSLEEFDRNAGIKRQQMRDSAVAAGAFGGGRDQVLQSQYELGSDRERALLQANLLQQGFQQAQQARGQDFERQRGLASMVPGLQRQDIQTLGSVGAGQQAQEQAKLDAQREAARQATFLPQENLSRYAGQVAGLMGGYPGQTTSSNVPNPSPMQNALTMGTGLAGIYGSLTGKY
jgi:hypothetical protein